MRAIVAPSYRAPFHHHTPRRGGATYNSTVFDSTASRSIWSSVAYGTLLPVYDSI